MKQSTINKIFALVLAILIVCVALLRINEQQRVEYYICYDRYMTMWPNADDEDQTRFNEICEFQLEERND